MRRHPASLVALILITFLPRTALSDTEVPKITGQAAAAHPAALAARKCEQARASGDMAQVEALSSPNDVAHIEEWKKSSPQYAEFLEGMKATAQETLHKPVTAVRDDGVRDGGDHVVTVIFGSGADGDGVGLIKSGDGYKCDQY